MNPKRIILWLDAEAHNVVALWWQQEQLLMEMI